MKDNYKAYEFGILVFASILVWVFSSNVGLVFLVRVVFHMLNIYVQQKEITTAQMAKIVLCSCVFTVFHMVQGLAYTLGILLKIMLSLVYTNLNADI